MKSSSGSKTDLKLHPLFRYEAAGRSTIALVVMVIVAVCGSIYIRWSHAATGIMSLEAENGSVTTSATVGSDATASGGKYVKFGAPGPPPKTSVGEGFSIPATELIFQSAANLDADMAKVANSGAQWIRFDFAAVQMETAQGQTNFTYTDAAVASAQKHNLHVLGLLTTLPAWSASNWTVGPATPAQRTAYTDWAVRVTQHYAGKVSAWEVWNEPNLNQFWSPTPSIAGYATLYKQVYPAIKPYTGTAKIITGGTGGAGGAPDIDSVAWVNGLYTNGLKGMYDGVAVHPYINGVTFPSGEYSKAQQIRAIMDSQGEADKELWGTEFGAPTSGTNSVSESQQAAIAGEGYSAWSGIHTTGPLFWYELRDRQNYGASTDREDYFGAFHKDNTPKQVYNTLTNWFTSH